MSTDSKKHLIDISDADLLEEIQISRNSNYLPILYKRFEAAVFGVALAMLKDFHAAEDAAGRTWVIIIEKIYDHKIVSLSNWILTISRNTCISYYRRKKYTKRFVKTGIMQVNDPTVDPDFYLEDNFELEEKLEMEMMDALERIPELQAKCVKLFYFEKMSYSEIAEELNLELKIVKSYLQNGKRLLFNELNSFLE